MGSLFTISRRAQRRPVCVDLVEIKIHFLLETLGTRDDQAVVVGAGVRAIPGLDVTDDNLARGQGHDHPPRVDHGDLLDVVVVAIKLVVHAEADLAVTRGRLQEGVEVDEQEPAVPGLVEILQGLASVVEQVVEEVRVVEHEDHCVITHHEPLVEVVGLDGSRQVAKEANFTQELTIGQTEHEQGQLGGPTQCHGLVSEFVQVSRLVSYD